MAKFLLVHGSCHGAWCWRDVMPVLRSMGHLTNAIDLPGHGSDPTDIRKISLASYADAVLSASDKDTIVVAHSMAGYPVTAAAEIAPRKLRRIVYLCAYVPQSGLSLAEMRKAWPEQPLLPAILTDKDNVSFTIDPEKIRDIFYHDCPPGTLSYAAPRLNPQAVAPQTTKLTITERSLSVPRSYIRCTDDRTIPPAYQSAMCDGWPDDDVYQIDTGHSPFFAEPKGLAAVLSKISEAPQ